MAIYTVYTLTAPEDTVIRYIGTTTQLPGKRLSDMMGVSRHAHIGGYLSPLSFWLRELVTEGKAPVLRQVLNTPIEQLATANFNRLFLLHQHSGRLLNSKGGRYGTRAMMNPREGRIGGPVNQDSASQVYSVRMKQPSC